MEEGEVVPVNLKNIRRDFRVKVNRPFLGLVPTGKKVKIGFECRGEHNQIISCLVKQRDTGAASLSNGFIEFPLDKNHDYLEVEQMNPAGNPSQKVVIDIFDTPFDACVLGSGSDPDHDLGPHKPRCPHQVASVTIRFSLTFAKLLAFWTALVLFVRSLPAKAREKMTKISERISHVRQSASQGVARVSSIPAKAQVSTKIASAQSRNSIRHLSKSFHRLNAGLNRRRPVVIGIALLLLLALGFEFVRGIIPRVEATNPVAQEILFPEEIKLVCKDKLIEVSPSVLGHRECRVANWDGKQPDEVICGKGHKTVATSQGVIITGCKAVWN